MRRSTFLALASSLFGFVSVLAQDIIVNAPAGTIIGQPGRLDPTVREFLGIPFALPPSGSRRFEPPVRAPVASNPISAKQFGFSCPSVFVGYNRPLPVNLTGVEDEDCLSLNIWTKPSLKNAPVLVWFYGGGFTWGTTDTLLYDGAHFVANNDVVMVTVNYRLNVFGFPNSPALDAQNLGLMDQRVAVEWVRDNIAAFGGNPQQITIFGHSAGGASVDFYSFAYPEDPIVSGFIEQSGAAGILGYVGGGSDFNAWNRLAGSAGCTGSDAEKLACLKSVPFKTIKDILTPDPPAPGECPSNDPGATGFGPRVDNKLVFSVEEYSRRGENGLFAKFPVLTGTTDQEIAEDGLTTPVPPGCPSIPGPIDGLPDFLPPNVLADIASAAAFTCPSRVVVQHRSDNNVPVWRYRYFGSFNFNSSFPLDLGAIHGAELPVLFGLADLIGSLPPREKAIVKEIQGAWAAFAKSPENGLSQAPFNWPKWSRGIFKKNLVRLAYEDELKATYSTNIQYDYWCDILSLLPDGTLPGTKRRRAVLRRKAPEGVDPEVVKAVMRLTPEQLKVLSDYVVKVANKNI